MEKMGDDLYPKTSVPKWWDSFKGNDYGSIDRGNNLLKQDRDPPNLANSARVALQALAFRRGEPVKVYSFSGYFKKGILDKVKEIIKEYGGVMFYQGIADADMKPFTEFYGLPTGFIDLSIGDGPSDASIINKDDIVLPEDVEELDGAIYTFAQDFIEAIHKATEEFDLPPLRSPRPEGRAFVLASTMGGTETISIGFGREAIVRENYAPNVLIGFDRAVKDLQSDKPRGRLVVLEGDPGSGKTYLVKAFMDAIPEAKFVIVPPHLIPGLSDPGLITTFVREMRKDETLVLVLEDADQCLSSRAADNMASISSILNLTDGIIGSLLDLRIVATTNTRHAEFDKALLRKGRISSHIVVGGLPVDQCQQIYRRLTNNPEAVYVGGALLADIYSEVSGRGDVEAALDDVKGIRPRMGFGQ